jgi:hypothetical protein
VSGGVVRVFYHLSVLKLQDKDADQNQFKIIDMIIMIHMYHQTFGRVEPLDPVFERNLGEL